MNVGDDSTPTSLLGAAAPARVCFGTDHDPRFNEPVRAGVYWDYGRSILAECEAREGVPVESRDRGRRGGGWLVDCAQAEITRTGEEDWGL